MSTSLLEHLASVPDFRRGQGKRYPLDAVLAMIIMGNMSGYYGYRELGTFVRSNAPLLSTTFALKREAMPSFVTIRTILRKVDFTALSAAFTAWARQHITLAPGDVLAGDGKALGSTVSNYDSEYQDFTCLVSLFSQRQGAVVSLARYHNGKQSEIPTISQVLSTLDITGVTITLDALHCKKPRSRRSSTVATTTSSRSRRTSRRSTDRSKH